MEVPEEERIDFSSKKLNLDEFQLSGQDDSVLETINLLSSLGRM